jgi:predicted exporter
MTRPLHRILIWFAAAGCADRLEQPLFVDMSFSPARPSAAQQVMIDQLQTGAVSRLLMMAIEGGNAVQRAAVSRDLGGRLAQRKEFVSVENGAAGSLEADRDFLFRHRYLLSPSVTPERFTIDGLRSAIANSIDLLASPAGILFKPYLTRDPTGELVQMLEALTSVSQPHSREGVWASRARAPCCWCRPRSA